MTIIFRVYYVLYFSAYYLSSLGWPIYSSIICCCDDCIFLQGSIKWNLSDFILFCFTEGGTPMPKSLQLTSSLMMLFNSKKQIYCWFIPLWSAYFYLFVNSTILYSPVFYKTYKCNETSAFASAVCSFIKSDLTINVLTDCIRDPFHVPCTRSYNHWHKIPLLPPCSAY